MQTAWSTAFSAVGSFQAFTAGTPVYPHLHRLTRRSGPQTGMCKATESASGQLNPLLPGALVQEHQTCSLIRLLLTEVSGMRVRVKLATAMFSDSQASSHLI